MQIKKVIRTSRARRQDPAACKKKKKNLPKITDHTKKLRHLINSHSSARANRGSSYSRLSAAVHSRFRSTVWAARGDRALSI